MDYKEFAQLYELLENTSKRLEKTFLISKFLKKANPYDLKALVYLLQGQVFPPWDERKLGMSSQLMVKVIHLSSGTSLDKIEKLWTKTGDLGSVAESLMSERKQTTLVSHTLTLQKVFSNLQSLATLEGEGTVNKKVQLISELLTSSQPVEAKFITRTVIGQLRVGIAAGILRDAIVWAFFPKVMGIFTQCPHCKTFNPETKHCLSCKKIYEPLEVDSCFKVKSLEALKKLTLETLEEHSCIEIDEPREAYNYFIAKVQELYDITNDFSEVVDCIRIKKTLKKTLKVGIPINPMLAIAIPQVEEAFEALGTPLLVEPKLDGFRLQIHKDHDKISLFTRRLENVTKQFQELIPIIQKNVKAQICILDTEAIGYNPKTKEYLPFQHISQRIKRKYDIEEIAEKIPVEIHVFDILLKEKEALITLSQEERRKILEKTVHEIPTKIVLTKKLISEDKEEIQFFYEKLLTQGFEGVMLKNLKKSYTPGRKVSGWLKMKPTLEPLDLVIVAADYGEGKRAGWLTSYTLACKNQGIFQEIGKSSTGLKEKSEGLSFEDMTKLLKPHILEQKGKHVTVKPALVIEVLYEEIQKSTNYDSGFALRFPRLLRLRNDKSIEQADDVKRVEQIYNTQKGKHTSS